MFPERVCSTCKDQNKKDWGCTTDTALPMTLDGVEIFRCPRRPLLDDPQFFNLIFSTYRHYKDGFLPVSGGILDQAPKMMRAMSAMSTVLEELREEASVKARAKAKKKPASRHRAKPARRRR